MTDLKTLKKKKELLEQLVSTFETLKELTPLDEKETNEYEKAKEDLKNISLTIANLESIIEYTKEELAVFSLDYDKQADAWFELLKKSDFSKDSILRICSMLKADGLLPCFKSEGICITEYMAHEAAKLLKEKGYECIMQITERKLFEVKNKLDNKLLLDEDDLYYKDVLEQYNTAENGISGKCFNVAYSHFVSLLHDKFEQTGNFDDRASYLVDRVIMALCHRGILASGEKEFIAMYFRDKK